MHQYKVINAYPDNGPQTSAQPGNNFGNQATLYNKGNQHPKQIGRSAMGIGSGAVKLHWARTMNSQCWKLEPGSNWRLELPKNGGWLRHWSWEPTGGGGGGYHQCSLSCEGKSTQIRQHPTHTHTSDNKQKQKVNKARYFIMFHCVCLACPLSA